MIESINQILNSIVGVVWGPAMVVILLGTGIVLTIYHRFVQFWAFPHAIALAFGLKKEPDSAPGEVSHFKALCTALSATVGLGNIAGVAVAISVGGPGATIWMILVGIIGMVTKFNECTLACVYRKLSPDGHVIGGGPMYYIERVAGGKYLAPAFAFFMMMAALGAANMFQVNQVAAALEKSFAVPPILVGIIMAIITAVVIIGGIQRIARVASIIVPVMGGIYVIGCLVVIFIFRENLLPAISFMFQDAFSGEAVAGGAIGAVITHGVRRALFSSEAGLGSAAVAHSMAKGTKPASQGLVALLEPFIDTVIICTITALAINVTGAWELFDENGARLTGVVLTQTALNSAIAGFGTWFIPVAVSLFAFSTLVSWSLYGEQAVIYLRNNKPQSKSLLIYKIIFCTCPILGAIWSLDPIIAFSDICLALMVIPNVWAMIWLSKDVKAALKDYLG